MADKPSTNQTSATLRVPVCVAAASLTALVAWGLAFAAAATGMSIQAIIVFASVATVAGCGILAAIVVVSFRNTSRKLQAVLSAKHAKQVGQLTDDMVASFGALRAELLEQHRQTRVAQFAASPAEQPQHRLRSVD
jgi:uncharacterized membrane protein